MSLRGAKRIVKITILLIVAVAVSSKTNTTNTFACG